MILQSIFFALLFGILDVGVSVPVKDEKIDPVDLNYFCFNLKDNGKNPSKSPILLIHGLFSNSADWTDIYEVLALDTGRRVCAVDLRNHGGTPWNNRSDVEAMTVDIEHFLDEKKIRRINLIGHSLGGKIAVHFALKHPKRVDSLVVEDMRPNGVTEKGFLLVKTILTFLQAAITVVPENSSVDEAKNAIINYISEKIGDVSKSLGENLKNLLALRFDDGKWQYKMNVNLMKKALENPENFLTPSTGLYKGPALFIYGTESIFDVAGDESNIRKLFPQAKLVAVAGAGHVIHGAYREFIDEVVKFLNNIR